MTTVMHTGQQYHAFNTLVSMSYVLTLVLLSSYSLSEHQPVQQFQILQFHFSQDCGSEYFRIVQVGKSINWRVSI